MVIMQQSASFLESIFQFTDPSYGLAYDVSLEDLLDKSKKELVTSRFSDEKSKQRIRIALANAYLGLGKTEKAKEQVEMMVAAPIPVDYHSIVGGLHYNLGNYEKSIKTYEKLLLEEDVNLSERLDILVNLVRGLSSNKELKKANTYIQTLKKLIKVNNPKNGRELILKATGFVSQKKKDFKSAVEIYEELKLIQIIKEKSLTNLIKSFKNTK